MDSGGITRGLSGLSLEDDHGKFLYGNVPICIRSMAKTS
jgi:hypothetical protein